MYTFKTSKNRLYDKLHKGTVCVLMGLSVFGALAVSYEFYQWWYVYRPQWKKAHNDQLLAESAGGFDEDYSERKLE